jgi:CRISPR type I-E-associated protein CasB/Cse2
MSDDDRLVDRLEALARQDDRATLAALRGSLREGRELDALRVVLPSIGVQGSARQTRREEDASLLAGLFALHPESALRSLASGLRLLAMASPGSDSIELRFRALLSASREDLAPHLRSAVTLLGSKGIALNWRDLYRALREWDAPKDEVRRAWARDYWGAPSETKDDAAAPTEETTNTPSEGTQS